MTIPAVLLYADTPPAQYLVGGVPLLVRHIKELARLGVREVYLCSTTPEPLGESHTALPRTIQVKTILCPPGRLPQSLCTLLPPPADILLIRADCLVDPRLLAELLSQDTPHWLRYPQGDMAELPCAARLSPALLDTWATRGLQQWLDSSPALDMATLDTYSRSHRGPVPFYVMALRTPTDAVAATKTLIHSAQKRALDLPALLVHPWFENRLVSWLCPTRITPNHVTICTAVLGGIAALLFLNGWLRVGILVAYAVAILDGVDGKLARTRLQTSRFGEYEHVLDFLVEHAWYVTITIFVVHSTGQPAFWWVGGGLIACDFLDNMVYYLGQVFFGKQLDELGRFDRQFRLIGGRRNIYAWMFLIGFWSGFPVAAFLAAGLWAMVTLGVHGVRLGYHLSRRAA
jgi:phosphatidylglycerophosphate synthase